MKDLPVANYDIKLLSSMRMEERDRPLQRVETIHAVRVSTTVEVKEEE